MLNGKDIFVLNTQVAKPGDVMFIVTETFHLDSLQPTNSVLHNKGGGHPRV